MPPRRRCCAISALAQHLDAARVERGERLVEDPERAASAPASRASATRRRWPCDSARHRAFGMAASPNRVQRRARLVSSGVCGRPCALPKRRFSRTVSSSLTPFVADVGEVLPVLLAQSADVSAVPATAQRSVRAGRTWRSRLVLPAPFGPATCSASPCPAENARPEKQPFAALAAEIHAFNHRKRHAAPCCGAQSTGGERPLQVGLTVKLEIRQSAE